MKKWLFTALFGTALVLGACGGGGDEGGSEEPADNGGDNGETTETAGAEEIYQNNCASCHGADLSGGAGPDLTAVGSKYSADEIVDIIHNGKGGMPAQKQVSDEDAQTLASWLADKK